ncbi:sulfite exporter TauE/SafE family protein [Ensifer sp. ENS04]|uniref:sulfite exporter TauE/SafE family protein n=1 Tax=Ensifer sp. ENS04 TaxID=2769281 RepID=UPI00177E20AC|nr:sulfite exporter TauE/SafE family protein [Ensifer sp. ENS04]MBD9541474.1 sulfite exporter TauE/SafE family protein [Ensifer sp. ENS04]
MPVDITGITILGSGWWVGFILAVVGGGGSILSVPLLMYVAGIESAHVAIGTSSAGVAIAALSSLFHHARAGNVRWSEAITFTLAGILGVSLGNLLARLIDGRQLLTLFGLVMVAVGVRMVMTSESTSAGTLHAAQVPARTPDIYRLLGYGLAVGGCAGFFGIGGGFLIVPGLISSTGMPITMAIGSSLMAVAAFGITTTVSYGLAGLVDWNVAGIFVAGGVLGGTAGAVAGRRLSGHKRKLTFLFSSVLIAVGFYVIARGIFTLIPTLFTY